jgi:hypothetical protein
VLEALHGSALVACLWHHVYNAAKRGLPLDDAVCRECSNLALKSVRDIIREQAAGACGVELPAVTDTSTACV